LILNRFSMLSRDVIVTVVVNIKSASTIVLFFSEFSRQFVARDSCWDVAVVFGITAELIGPFNHLGRGRPSWHFQVGSGGQPTDGSTWSSMTWCVGVLSGRFATCPNMAFRPITIWSDTGGTPLSEVTSVFCMKSCYLIPRIIH